MQSSKPPIPTPSKRKTKMKTDYHGQLRDLEDKVLQEKRRDEQRQRELDDNVKVTSFLKRLFRK